jgi:uncharacterized protein involved in outer membrane biogenesis
MSKTIKIALAAMVLIGVAALLFIHLWLGTIVKAAIEQVGPTITKTSIKLDGVTISPLRGLVELKGLEVGNPSGYKSPTAMKLGTARLRMNVFSVLSKTIVVDEILVEAPEITVEGGLSKNNLLTIQDNVMHAGPGGGSPAGGERKAAEPAAPSSIKILIKEFTFKNGKAAAHLDAGPLGTQDLSMGLPDIHLKDIGKDTGGATPEQAVSAVFSAVTRAVTGSAGESLKSAGKGVTDAASRAVEGVKGLFK